MLPNHYSELSHNPSANVAVVNLVYDAAKAQLPTPGFGYLIPRSENSAQNHKGLLGVVFDSCATPGQDTGPSNGNVIKLTAMIGGYMFDEVASTQHLSPAATEGHSSSEVGNAKKYSPISKGFEKDQVRRLELFFKEVATDAVMNHLNIETEPELVRVHIQHNCIPQYLVGHLQRMQSLDEALRRDFDGMLAVTGAGYLGVSVNDCIKNAREVVEAIVSKLDEEDSGEAELVGKQDAVTGLERASK
ncbi:hypothetical protein BGW38_010681 [Lunasporangiospora selenospora]|uniref:Protoporphyrinogen oxidase n=1 Tax=Lunasporangiospora selenospora TaxID=979761 RepID=A0A9P6FWN0_9FUNG|nr:hypothetical protein BGW38_010681 [Lunasporangiospora selenospora]